MVETMMSFMRLTVHVDPEPVACPAMTGTVEAIFTAPVAGAGTEAQERVAALARQGLEGDRNLSPAPVARPGGLDLTLIEAEALEALRAETGIALEPSASRRNVVTRGVRLNDLVGRSFRVGVVECVGIELCEPCLSLARRTDPGVLRGLAHRGGLRADIVVGGEIAPGDEVVAI
jgi:MOSC domain-containing protein YiiM